MHRTNRSEGCFAHISAPKEEIKVMKIVLDFDKIFNVWFVNILTATVFYMRQKMAPESIKSFVLYIRHGGRMVNGI
jgi:hypothetical protein